MAKAKLAGAKASRAAQRAKISAEIEYQKSKLNQTQKDFGVAVWDSVKAKDNSKIQSIFKTFSSKVTETEALIEAKMNALKEIDSEQNPALTGE